MHFSPSQQQIAEILPHLRYEIEQTFVVPVHDQNDWHIRESVFLAVLVRARLLLKLLEHTSREHDDLPLHRLRFPACSSPAFEQRPDASQQRHCTSHIFEAPPHARDKTVAIGSYTAPVCETGLLDLFRRSSAIHHTAARQRSLDGGEFFMTRSPKQLTLTGGANRCLASRFRARVES
jgi:hypothetical protein